MSKTSFTYLKSINKYLSSDWELYTDDQLDYLRDQETDWRNSLPNYSFHKLIEIFPEAIKPARRGLKEKLKLYKRLRKELDQRQEDYYNDIICKAHFKDQVYLKEYSDETYEDKRKEIDSKIKSIIFKLSHLDNLEGKKEVIKFKGVNEIDIARAKEVPIENFYTGKLKRGVGICPFHSEKTGSFKIYKNQNSWWCFGACGKGGSVIDFIMEQQNIDFLSAVKQILNIK